MSSMKEQEGRSKRLRRAFTEEFKAGAVGLVLDEGTTIAQVARDLDLSANSVATWVSHARADQSKGKTGLTAPSLSGFTWCVPWLFELSKRRSRFTQGHSLPEERGAARLPARDVTPLGTP